MTGTLNSYSSLTSIGAINFYYTTSEEEEPHTEPVTLITGNDIVKYERRMLLYPYMPRSNERPLVVAYLEKVEVLKIFVPKMCTRIRVVDKQNQEQDIEGTFMDVTDPASMLEYNIDKVVTLMNVSSEEAATTYFSTIHQDPLVDAHREDFEIVPGHIQERSLVNVYLTKLSNRPRTAEGLGSILWSNDESMWFMGTKLNEIHNRLSIYPTGVKAHSSFLKDDFSIDFIGDSVSGSDTVYLDTETTDTKYRRWAYDNDRYNFPKRHIIWGRFRWKLTTDIDDFNNRIAAKQDEINAKQDEINAKQDEINAKQDEINAKQDEINAKQAEINAKQAEINANKWVIEKKYVKIVSNNPFRVAVYRSSNYRSYIHTCGGINCQFTWGRQAYRWYYATVDKTQLEQQKTQLVQQKTQLEQQKTQLVQQKPQLVQQKKNIQQEMEAYIASKTTTNLYKD